MSFPVLLILLNIRTSYTVYPDGYLYYSDNLDADDVDEWVWLYNYEGTAPAYYYASSSNCPDIGFQCFAPIGSSSSNDGRITKTFSTVGIWDVFITIKINVVLDDSLDTCLIRTSSNGGSFFDRFADFDYSLNEGTYWINIDPSAWDNPLFTIRLEADGDSTNDRCYFRKLQIYGKPITPSPTDNPTPSPAPSPTRAPTHIPTLDPVATTDIPTLIPSQNPTKNPNTNPTISPTLIPTLIPTIFPTEVPSNAPIKTTSNTPTIAPTDNHSERPTKTPSIAPTTELQSGVITNVMTTKYEGVTVDQNVDLMMVLVVSILIMIIAVCCCAIFCVCYMKKNRQLNKSIQKLGRNVFGPGHVTIIGQNSVDMTVRSATSVTSNEDVYSIGTEQLMIPSETQLEGIVKIGDYRSQITTSTNGDSDDMYDKHTEMVTQGDSHDTLGRDADDATTTGDI